jgi:ubiquinone/menaquinone biosynthesis C-methylase UbiE
MTGPVTGRFIKPENAVTHFHLHEGDRIADFGAGGGFFEPALSRAVGRDGRVYACEIQKVLVDKLGGTVREQKLSNVEPLWCDFETQNGAKLSDGVLDAAVLSNTLNQLEDKETALREVARTVRKGGKLFVIDWNESFQGLGPISTDIVDEETAKSLIEAAGFQFERTFDGGDHHYGLAFRRV